MCYHCRLLEVNDKSGRWCDDKHTLQIFCHFSSPQITTADWIDVENRDAIDCTTRLEWITEYCKLLLETVEYGCPSIKTPHEHGINRRPRYTVGNSNTIRKFRFLTAAGFNSFSSKCTPNRTSPLPLSSAHDLISPIFPLR